MIIRFFILLVGFGLSVAGGVSLLAYLNFIAAGYDIATYFQFILHRIEFYFLIIGGILIWVSMFQPSKRKKSKHKKS